MRVVACIVVAGIFVSTTKADQPNLNLPLDAVLKFDEINQPRDLTVIDQVQDVLQKIKNTMRRRSGRRHDTDNLSFAEFVLEAAKILRDYNDNDLEDVYAVIDDESRRFIRKESSLQDIFGNDFRKRLSDQLDAFKDMPAASLRRLLDTAIDVLESNNPRREIQQILDLGNTLYSGAGDKLKTALRSFERARRSNGDVLEDMLRSTLKSLVFDQYSKLNYDVKDDLLQMARSFWDVFNGKNDNRNLNQRVKFTKPPVKNDRQDKYGNIHKFYLKTHSKIKTRGPSWHWTEHSYGPTEQTSTTKRNQEIFLSQNELKKLTNIHPRDYNELRHTQNNPYRSHKKDVSMELKKRPHIKYKSKIIESHGHNTLRERNKQGTFDSRDSQLLTGGLAVQDIYFRAESSDDTERTDQTDEPRHTKGYSDSLQTELSSENDAQNSGSFTSAERSKSEDSRYWEQEETSKSESSPNFRASSEGIGIESFENDYNVERKVLRKSNYNDTLLPDPRAPENVRKLIENIEKEIDDVKGQVEYVKHLEDDIVEQPEFKTIDSDENHTNTSPYNSATVLSNAYKKERDSYAFFSSGSNENATSGAALRAHDDSDDNIRDSESENSTKTIVTKKATETLVTTNGSTINKTVEEQTVKSAPGVKDNISISDNLSKRKANTDEDNEVDKPNDTVTYTPNENITNATAITMKYEVDKNTAKNETLTTNVNSYK